MTRHAKLLLGGVALGVLALGGAAAIARHGHTGWGGHGMGHHGGVFGPGMGRMGMLCRDGRAAEMADHMLVRIEHRLKPTESQKAAVDELKTAVRSAAAKVQAACPAKSAAATPPAEGTPPARPSPIERLANAETMTAATLEAIKTVRPAAEKLYATLSDEQKKAIEERPNRGRWGWKRHRDGERGGPDGRPGHGPGRDDGDADTLP